MIAPAVDHAEDNEAQRQLARMCLDLARAAYDSGSVPTQNRELVGYGLHLLERDGMGLLDIQRRMQAEEIRFRQSVTRPSQEDLTEALGDYIDPRWQFDDAAIRFMAPMTWNGDRKGGINWPIFRTELELNIIRGQARFVVDTSVNAKGALETLTDYVIGTGYTYTAAEKKGRKAPEGLVEAVQLVIDETLEENDFPWWERELFYRKRRDGEYFIHYYQRPAAPHRTTYRSVEPEQVTESSHDHQIPQDLPATSWTFGVHTLANDVQEILGYNVVWDTGEAAEYVERRNMLHVRSNVDRSVKRGLPDFYPVVDGLEGARKLLRNTREGAAIQAAIAFIKQAPAGTDQATVKSMNAAQTDFTVGRFSNSSTQNQANVRRFDQGTILTIPAGWEYLAGPMGSPNAANYLNVLQATLRNVAVRWAMPEGIISGDNSNNNYASALVAEGPFAKRIKRYQAECSAEYRQMILWAIRNAADQGRFARFGIGWMMISRLIEVQVDTPSAESRDFEKETRVRAVLNQAQILSAKTWGAKEGLDWDVEQAQIAKEKAANPQADQPGAKVAETDRAAVGSLAGALECCDTVSEAKALVQNALRRYP